VQGNKVMAADLVSIIVPAYGHESYVLDCLQSLHTQTHERLELILIDDCSPDRTFNLAQALLATRFASRFENVVLKRKAENRGTHDSLNIGLELASGDYIAIVNSDDLFKPQRVERLLAAMKESGSEFAFSIVETLDDGIVDGERNEKNSASLVPENLLLLGLRQRLAIARDVSVGFALLRQNVGISTGNFLFSAQIAKRIGEFLPLKYCHDWDFILQALLHTEPVAVLEPLYDYRLHQQNSFRAYQNLAEIETEVVLRRFFRSVLAARSTNPLCPSPENWPGYFEAFIRGAGYWSFWARESGEPLPEWRTYDQSSKRYLNSSLSPSGIFSTETAFRLLAESPTESRGTNRRLIPG
jgi:glycosyltransferase involved in cell wall biosynthesis